MWLCDRCKSKFLLRSLLLLHKSKDCLRTEETTNKLPTSINNLAMQDDVAVHDEVSAHSHLYLAFIFDK